MSFDVRYFGLLATVFLLRVYMISGARSGGDCTRGHYPSDGECERCPVGCETCTSVNSCEICVLNRYGTTCQKTCKQQCKHANCDKVYGHCPEGCPHGEFPNLATKECNKCPASCAICSSPTKCIKCKPGHFRVNGECHTCVDGCARCDNARTCSTCKDGYMGPYDGRCALSCKEANKTWLITKSNDDRSYDFPEVNCAQIPPDKESYTYHVTGNCLSDVKCPEGIRCHVDGKNVTTEDTVCGISETYRCMVDCERLNGTSCQCHVMCSSWTFRQQHTPTCPRDSDEHFGSVKTDCATEYQRSTTKTPTTASMTPLIVALVISVVLCVVATYIVWTKRALVAQLIRSMRRSPAKDDNLSVNEEGQSTPGNEEETSVEGKQSPVKEAQPLLKIGHSPRERNTHRRRVVNRQRKRNTHP